MPLYPQLWFDEACNYIHRNLTAAEWKDVLGPNVPYHKTCANRP
jgi:hypothetical protein